MTHTPPDLSAGTVLAVLAYPGVDELDLFGAYAILGKAGLVAQEQGLAPVRVVIAASNDEVRGSGGVTFRVQEDVSAVTRAQAVVVPGGRGAAATRDDDRLRRTLRMAYDGGTRLYSVCSGALVLAGAGLAEGRVLAVHSAKRQQLLALGAKQAAHGLVRDDRICSVGGDIQISLKSVDLAYALLADLRPELIEPVARRTEVRPGRSERGVPEDAHA
ncbi:DJ-1/PfpI family protein [Micromonospora haikouensis]|uniref:DJ-1/PfpI family protein n=1 Tax=Micromonospora haikouensis TaxID=686309 RepID=A0A1C4XEM5_9ACTN|nr:DJ-1/PfpI family protein [Micromonospora haikouensis]SCF06581.1 DJ-1/PfpI family protein [Micromonospora haikouensis]